LEILNASKVRRANLHHHAKFRASLSNHCIDMAIFWLFKMATVRHLGFLKVLNFNYQYSSDGQYALSLQILQSSVKPLPTCFKMAAIQHLRFLKVKNFNCPLPFGGPICIILPNFVRSKRLEIWPLFFFQDGSRPPS